MGIHEEFRQRPKRRKSVTYLSLRHPVACLCFYISMLTLVFLFQHPVFAVEIFLLILFHAFYLLGIRHTLGYMKVYMIFGVMVALINPLLVHRGSHILFYLFDQPITLEATLYGGCISLMILSMLMCFLCVNHLLNSGKFLYLFSRAMPQTTFIAAMTLRYFTLLKDRAEEYAGVQRVRTRLTEKRKIDSIREAGALLGGFSAWTLEEGMQVSESLRAKEYGMRKRSLYAKYSFRREDGIWTGLVVGLFLGITGLKFLGAGLFDFYRNMQLAPNPIDFFAILVLALFMFLPMVGDAILYIKRKFNIWSF